MSLSLFFHVMVKSSSRRIDLQVVIRLVMDHIKTCHDQSDRKSDLQPIVSVLFVDLQKVVGAVRAGYELDNFYRRWMIKENRNTNTYECDTEAGMATAEDGSLMSLQEIRDDCNARL